MIPGTGAPDDVIEGNAEDDSDSGPFWFNKLTSKTQWDKPKSVLRAEERRKGTGEEGK